MPEASAPRPGLPRRHPPWRKLVESVIEFSLLCCGLLSIATTLAIAGVLIFNSWHFFEDNEYDARFEKSVLAWNARYHQDSAALADWRKAGEATPGELLTNLEDRWSRTRNSAAKPGLDDLAAMLESEQSLSQAIDRWRTDRFPRIRNSDFQAIRQAIDQRVILLDREDPVTLGYFLTGSEWSAAFANARYGILPLVVGTLMVAVIAAFIAVPIGLTTAIYLSEYARPRVRNLAKPTLELLAGIPTVVYGFFAVITVTPFLQYVGERFFGVQVESFNQLAGGIVVGIMIIPMVASLSEDALRSVPRSLRDASYALGATKFETSMKVVVPAGLSGVVASFILAISRAIGETMAVSLACGDSNRLTLNPLEGAATMTSFIVRIAKGDVVHGTTDYYSLFAVGLVLFLMTLVMNVVAEWVRGRYRLVYQ